MPIAPNGETPAHRELKRLALVWAGARRLVLGASEVRLPRSNYRADVAAATLRALSGNAVTVVFECKASRADFLIDSAPETGAAENIAQLRERLMALRSLIAGHRPDLRCGEELFAEFDAYDLRGLKHETHDRLSAELRVAERKLQEGTKFARLFRWRSASLLYLVTEAELLEPRELPEGWGWLVRRGEELELRQRPCLRDTTPAERVALVERITATLAGRERMAAASRLALQDTTHHLHRHPARSEESTPAGLARADPVDTSLRSG
jgi:hypothetical protein